eukprot:14396473-Alexandrium_andersonii.AAC.1
MLIKICKQSILNRSTRSLDEGKEEVNEGWLRHEADVDVHEENSSSPGTKEAKREKVCEGVVVSRDGGVVIVRLAHTHISTDSANDKGEAPR